MTITSIFKPGFVAVGVENSQKDPVTADLERRRILRST